MNDVRGAESDQEKMKDRRYNRENPPKQNTGRPLGGDSVNASSEQTKLLTVTEFLQEGKMAKKGRKNTLYLWARWV
jgi:hypothetical protein